MGRAGWGWVVGGRGGSPHLDFVGIPEVDADSDRGRELFLYSVKIGLGPAALPQITPTGAHSNRPHQPPIATAIVRHVGMDTNQRSHVSGMWVLKRGPVSRAKLHSR